jgi:nicotinamidase-related amidase
MKIDLLVIDPQYDFCNPKGNLYVAGAEDDMKRLSSMIKKGKAKINNIHSTLDQHHIINIAHPIFWRDSTGNHPDPFTLITIDDLADGTWMTTKPSMMKRATEYIKELAFKGRYVLCIWPPHCIIGSLGATIVPEVYEAYCEWESERFAMVNKVAKGSNFWTEHYSAVQAEVPDPDDPGTAINISLINALKEADVIGIAGEALSHCVANTIRDIADEVGDNIISKYVLLEDATSSVTGFEQLGVDFVKEMVSRGMKISNTKDFL